MNVLSQAPASSAISMGTEAVQSALALPAAQPALAQSGQAFSQVWGQQSAQLAAVLDTQPEQAPALQVPGADAQAQAFAVELSDVLPVLHLPAQQMLHGDARQQAVQAALGLAEGETLEVEGLPEDALPAMQLLSALPVVHPQLRRTAVSSVEAGPAAGAHTAFAQVGEVVARSVAGGLPLAEVSSAAPATGVSAPVTSAAAGPISSAQGLVQALGQRIQLQQAQGQDVVTVRLDPPQWGRLEIRIQQDASGVQVLLQASHSEVGRQLTTVVDSLRQELQARTGGDASVVVAHSQRAMGGQSHGERHAQHGAQADNAEAPVGQALQFDMGDDAV